MNCLRLDVKNTHRHRHGWTSSAHIASEELVDGGDHEEMGGHDSGGSSGFSWL